MSRKRTFSPGMVRVCCTVEHFVWCIHVLPFLRFAGRCLHKLFLTHVEIVGAVLRRQVGVGHREVVRPEPLAGRFLSWGIARSGNCKKMRARARACVCVRVCDVICVCVFASVRAQSLPSQERKSTLAMAGFLKLQLCTLTYSSGPRIEASGVKSLSPKTRTFCACVKNQGGETIIFLGGSRPRPLDPQTHL